MVWRQASQHEGFRPPAKDWKLHYVTCVRLLQRMKKGKAFQHKSFAPKCFQCSDVRDVAFWNGCILAGEIIELHPFYFSSPSSFSVPLSLPVQLFNLFGIEGDGLWLCMYAIWLCACIIFPSHCSNFHIYNTGSNIIFTTVSSEG